MPLGNPTLVRWVSLGNVRHHVTFSRHSCEPKHVSIIWKISFILCVFVRVLTFTNCDKTDMREEGIENRARIIWGNVLLSEQYYPILDVGALGRRFWLWGLQRGSGFHFSASASQRRAAKYSFRSQHFLLFLPWLKSSGFTQTSRRLRQGWPVYSPISQWASKTHICHTNYSKHCHKLKKKKSHDGHKWSHMCAGVCMHVCKYSKRLFPIQVNSFKWLSAVC